MGKIVVAYVPVLHAGYRAFFDLHRDADILYVFGTDFAVGRFPYLQKDVRALDPEHTVRALRAWGVFPKVEILTEKILLSLLDYSGTLVFPAEDVSRELAPLFTRGDTVFESVFLRWNRDNVTEERPVQPDRAVSVNNLDREMLIAAEQVAGLASDWWRQIGAVIARNGVPLLIGYNRHVPTDHTQYIDGDPRNCFKRGLHIDIANSHHAEKVLICEAARRGVPLEGADLYVTTFPCPLCAKDIPAAGIRRCYYSSGYAVLDGESVMRDQGVELVFVDMKTPPSL